MESQHIATVEARRPEALNPEEARGSLRAQLPQLDRFLEGEGIAYLEQNYEGNEGTGTFTSTRFIGANGQVRECQLPAELRDPMCRLLMTLIDRRFPRWRMDHGSFGSFVWDLMGDAVEHRHSDRYISYDTSFWYGL